MEDDGEVDISYLMLSNSDVHVDLDEFMKPSTCTHTHMCNPPGPDGVTHTHTCYHTHKRVLSSEEEEQDDKERPKKSYKPLGNREAVRKYREKKRAYVAYLEEEVRKLCLTNQQLLRSLESREALEAEVMRLRYLLLDLRGKIDTEFNMFPLQRPCSGTGIDCGVGGTCFSRIVGIADCRVDSPSLSRNDKISDCHVDPNHNVEQHVETKVVESLNGVGTW